MRVTAVSYEERPGLWEEMDDIGAEVWPEYNRHGDVLNQYWGRLYDEFAGFQFALLDPSTGEAVAEGHSAPCPWDGTDEGLGEGIDSMLARLFDARSRGEPPSALCALAAEILPSYQGRGLALRLLDEMAELARARGLGHLIAPVRPSLKERYPLAPIERYVAWMRDDGLPLDPWIRTHVRRGGRIARTSPHGMRITGTVDEWESWTEMRFPDDGDYTFPHGLAPLSIDHATDRGAYWEPNVWIVHETM